MGTNALWLSMQEKVEVESRVASNPFAKYQSPMFRVRRKDGSTSMVERRDILLDEEQVLVDELAEILYTSKQPVKHERYSFIMKQFLVQGVPYVNRLNLRKVKASQLQLELFDVG